MKSSQILASVLFGTFAAAVPFKRDLLTKTEIEVETVVVYTTVWDDEVPTAEATTTAGGYFYEQPVSSAAETTPAAISTPVYTPPAVQEPSSVYTPPVQTPAPSSAEVVVPSAAPAPAPVETSAAPAPAAPTTTEAAYTPAPVSSAAPAASSAAPAPAAPAPAAPAPAAPAAQEQSSGSSGSSSSGESFTGDLTIDIIPADGVSGACGKTIKPTDLVVALAKPAWGVSSHDVMTGESTNPWCGKKINIEHNGQSVAATIMDLCPGCTGHDIDVSGAVWSALGMAEPTRVKGVSWSLAA